MMRDAGGYGGGGGGGDPRKRRMRQRMGRLTPYHSHPLPPAVRCRGKGKAGCKG